MSSTLDAFPRPTAPSRSEIDVALEELRPLAERLVQARWKHPEGTSFDDVANELFEAEHAASVEGEARFRDEMLDVSASAFRVFNGEEPK